MEITQEKECIEKSEILTLRSKSNVIIVDVRSSQEYNEQHIEGALNIELDKLTENLSEFNNANLIVTACGKGGGRSSQAAKILKKNGLNAEWLCGGTFGWS